MIKELRKLLNNAIDVYLNTATSAEQKFILKKRKVPDRLLDEIKAALAEEKKSKIAEATQRIIEAQQVDDTKQWHDGLANEMDELRTAIHEDKEEITKYQGDIANNLEQFAKILSPSYDFVNNKWLSKLKNSAREVLELKDEVKSLRPDLAREINAKLNMLSFYSDYDDNRQLWDRVWIQMHWAIEIRVAENYLNQTQTHLKSCEDALTSLVQLQLRHEATHKDKESLLDAFYKMKLDQEIAQIDQYYKFETNFPDHKCILEKLVERLRIHEKFDENLNKELDAYDEAIKEQQDLEESKKKWVDRIQTLINGMDNHIVSKAHRASIELLLYKVSNANKQGDILDLIMEIDRWEIENKQIKEKIAKVTGVQHKIYTTIKDDIAELQDRGQTEKVNRLSSLALKIHFMDVTDETTMDSFKTVLREWKATVINSKSNFQVLSARGISFFICKPKFNDAHILNDYEAMMVLE